MQLGLHIYRLTQVWSENGDSVGTDGCFEANVRTDTTKFIMRRTWLKMVTRFGHRMKGWGFHWRLCLFIRTISKTHGARITKLDTEMFHHESWKSIYFGVKRSKVKVTRQKNSVGVGFALLWVVASSSSSRVTLQYTTSWLVSAVYDRFFVVTAWQEAESTLRSRHQDYQVE